MATIQVEVVSAERRLFEGEANEVYARSLEGEIGILPGHQPALLTLDIAPVRIRLANGGQETIAVHHGFLYFHDNRLVVLADMAELESEIEPQRAEHEIERYEERLSKKEDAETRAALKRAKTRREVAG